MVNSHLLVRIISKAYVVDHMDRWRVRMKCCLGERQGLNNVSILILTLDTTSAHVKEREPGQMLAHSLSSNRALGLCLFYFLLSILCCLNILLK